VATVAWQLVDRGPDRLALAEPSDVGLIDTDGDLVPDSVEWLMQTDDTTTDTHQDGVDDFLAILTHRNLLGKTSEPPVEHGMRVLVTSTTEGGDTNVWLHLMVRFIDTKNSGEIYIAPYIDVRGQKASLVPAIGYGNVSVASKRNANSMYFFISCKLVNEASLTWLLPCTLGAEGLFDRTYVNTGTYVVNSGDSPHAMLPSGKNTFVLQPINANVRFQDPNPFWKGGKVCVMKLSIVSASPNGHLCEVTSAKCEPAAGLRCASSCSSNVGQPVFVPGGLGTITGN
jgi:hypothetical protein